MKQDYKFSMNCASVDVDQIKMHVIQSKNGVTANVSVKVKN